MDLTKEQIELSAINATPGILPKDTQFESYIGHNVINLSNVELTEHQLRALEKGLTFCPSPGAPDKSQIWEDFKEFHRRLELMQFFSPKDKDTELNISQSIIDFMNENATNTHTDQEDTQDEHQYEHIHQKFRNKSKWKPNPPNKTLDSFKRAFKMNLLQDNTPAHINTNLTKEEWKGINQLQKNPHIVIKKADKGSAVVIMQTTDYLREGYRQLNDRDFYTKLTEDPTQSISERICQVLVDMKNLKLISEKTFDFLNIKNPKAGRFYLLPKIHKKTGTR